MTARRLVFAASVAMAVALQAAAAPRSANPPAAAALSPPKPVIVCPDTAGAGDAVALPHLAAALKPGATLQIVAIGSANAFAPDLPAPTGKPAPVTRPSGLPAQVALALEAAVPGTHVGVTTLAASGLTAGQMLDKLRAELPRKPYRLVLWQTGTVEAVNDAPPDDFYQALSDGAAAAADAGADLVLIDPQYSRFLEGNANLAPYVTALQAAGGLPGVMLFHRFETMRDWAGNGFFDLEHTPKADRPTVAAHLHTCLARALVNSLLADVALSKS
jgi:hypothetical protein